MLPSISFQHPRFAGITQIQFKPSISDKIPSVEKVELEKALSEDIYKNRLLIQVFHQLKKNTVDYFPLVEGTSQDSQFQYYAVSNEANGSTYPEEIKNEKMAKIKSLKDEFLQDRSYAVTS